MVIHCLLDPRKVAAGIHLQNFRSQQGGPPSPQPLAVPGEESRWGLLVQSVVLCSPKPCACLLPALGSRETKPRNARGPRHGAHLWTQPTVFLHHSLGSNSLEWLHSLWLVSSWVTQAQLPRCLIHSWGCGKWQLPFLPRDFLLTKATPSSSLKAREAEGLQEKASTLLPSRSALMLRDCTQRRTVAHTVSPQKDPRSLLWRWAPGLGLQKSCFSAPALSMSELDPGRAHHAPGRSLGTQHPPCISSVLPLPPVRGTHWTW